MLLAYCLMLTVLNQSFSRLPFIWTNNEQAQDLYGFYENSGIFIVKNYGISFELSDILCKGL